jgi:hypothetical protein
MLLASGKDFNMLKLIPLASGLFIVATVANISQAAIFQNHSTPPKINSNLYGQRLMPIKKTVDFKKIIINSQLSIDKNQNHQKIDKNEYPSINCQRELSQIYDQRRLNERPDPSSISSKNLNNYGNSDYSNRSNGCSWSLSY